MAAVDLIGELPILGFFNHLGGAVVGAAAALVIVWLLFLIITLLYNNAIGQSCFEMIEKKQYSDIFLYDKQYIDYEAVVIFKRGFFDLEKSVLKNKIYILQKIEKNLLTGTVRYGIF